jgi:hypothetical protein
MMLFKPTLVIREVAVYRGTSYAYRETLHDGVNIIAGENSSGKSTILSLIVYGLGADISSWSEQAQLCDRVSLEVVCNGNRATFSRLISAKSGQPMEIYAGPLNEAEQAPVSQWMRFPYRTSGERESFSQAVFNLLALPELQTDTSGKLTLHQLLRLMYSDQLSAVDHIFRDENFDSPQLREAIGRFLMGAYDTDIYANQLRIRELDKELAAADATLRGIYALLADVNHSLTLEWAAAERRGVEEQLIRLAEDASNAEAKLYEDDDANAVSLEPQRRALDAVRAAQIELAAVDQQIEGLTLEHADSEVFLNTLKRKIEALRDSATVAEAISEVEYSWCPACFATLPSHDNPHTCRLCKAPMDEERMRRRVVGQLNELLVQQKQSASVQADRERELVELDVRKNAVVARWREAAARLGSVRRTPQSESREHLSALNEQMGYLRRELEEITRQERLISRLEALSTKKVDVTAELTRLKDVNDRLAATQQERLSNAYQRVESETLALLHNDLPRQDSFENARSVSFDFKRDSISVDGHAYSSASSTIYLKNALLSSFLIAASEDPGFRHFRLLILDTIEDKGMEPERSKNFQRLIAERSASLTAQHQIIFATAMISPNLDNAEYVIGRKSTHAERTLIIG